MTDEFGWEWGFYVLVIIMGIFCLIFAVIVADYPISHRWISDEERMYISESQQGHVTTKKVLIKNIFCKKSIGGIHFNLEQKKNLP